MSTPVRVPVPYRESYAKESTRGFPLKGFPVYSNIQMARERIFPLLPNKLPFSFYAQRLVEDAKFRADLRQLSDLTPEQFDQLSSALAAYPTFLNKQVLGELVGNSVPNADARLTGLIWRLNQMMRASAESLTDALQSLISLLSGKSDEFPKATVDLLKVRIQALILNPVGFSRQSKAEILSEATGAELAEIRVICDIRPVFDIERKTVEGAVAISTLLVELYEPDGSIKAVECRLTEIQLNRLAKRITEAQGKLAAIKDLLKQKGIPLAITDSTTENR